ncbi:MAG: hypothetical protein M1817_005631 [Caeruleum heppii]|nr:MAG: hypothetical protein M1817_005631 [Caeruleum heppii]
MTIRTFDDWAASRAKTSPLGALKDAVVGIEAAYFLHRLLDTPPTKEPLLSALGGFPFALASRIEEYLDDLQSAGITPFFVFDGMSFGKKGPSSADDSETVRRISQAWELYDRHQAIEAVATFGDSGAVKPESLYRYLQRILHSHKTDFMVAPYSASAQLAYFEKCQIRFVDAVMGSSELLLFDIDKVITSIEPQHAHFNWISKQSCQDDLGKISGDMFTDAALLCGTSFLPTFPLLQRKPFIIRDTVSMMLAVGPSATSVCTHYQDDPQVQQVNYLDKYWRAKMAIKHHVVLAENGRVEPLDAQQAPSDVHEFIGQRLPEELYFYLSKGLVAPRVLDWLVTGELYESPPLDNGESDEYHRLVRDQLGPIRTQALALLSQPMSRFYHRKDVVARFWFDSGTEKILSHKELVPSPRDLTSGWNVKEKTSETLQGVRKASRGSLAFAVGSLADKTFVRETMVPKDASSPLVAKNDILSNTLWRFLQLRGYADEKHTPTAWGKALLAAMTGLDPADQLEEPTFLAMELLRLGLLNANDVFGNYIGAPQQGTDSDKSNCLLISRVACLGKLRHKPIGFTGPLSRNLLAYHSFISAVRGSLRDLVEMVMINLLLNGDADRERNDWVDLGLDLPFIDDNDCGLGIAVKSYLDELAAEPNPTSPERRSEAKAKGAEAWFPHSVDMAGGLASAFRLWDAVLRGVKAADGVVTGVDTWIEVDEWLKDRR